MFMQKMKRIAAMLLAMIFLFSMSLTVLAGGFNQDARTSAVMVLTEIETTVGTIYSWGTGFFIGEEGKAPQYLLTNYHVVEDFQALGGGGGVAMLSVVYDGRMEYKQIIGAEESGGETYLTVTSEQVTLTKTDYEEAYFIAGDEVKDIALLKIGTPTNKRNSLPLSVLDDTRVSEQVYAIGFPGSAEDTINAVASFGVNSVTVTSGTISRILTESGTGRSLIQTDTSISGGNSGGPLVDVNGAVLGLNTYGSNLDPNLFYAVNISEAIPLLQGNSVPFSYYSEEIDYMQYLPLALAILAGVIIIVVVIVLVIRGKKKPAMAMANAGGVVSDTQVVNPPQNVVPMQHPILRCMAAQHGGMTIALSQQPILIGRDVAACRIVFKEGTPGVSSKHCQINYDEASGVFVLTDLKSTYGTFLANGQKCTPHVPYTLRQRDSFYLGEPDNALYVDLG